MTNEEAIEWFKSSAFYHKDHEPFNMAIDALSQQSEDAISRRAANRIFDKLMDYPFEEKDARVRDSAYIELLILPSVTPKQKTGHWIDTGSGQKCSECHEIQYGYDNYRFYCPNCGTKMETKNE